MAAPNFLGIIDAYEAGSRNRERNRLADLAERGRMLTGAALNGDPNAERELAGVDAGAFMQVKSFTQQQKVQRLDEIASGAMAADTAEKWQAFVQRSEATGHKLEPWERQFENRQGVLDQAMGWQAKLAQSNSDRTFDAQQTQSDRAYNLDERQFAASQRNAAAQLALENAKLQGNGPDLVELFDDQTGQPYKARWNPQAGKYERVGGVKAPSGTQLEVGPDGTVSFTQGMGKITEGQGKDISYLNRILTAAPILDKNDEALTSLGESVAGRAPLGLGNYAKSSEFQQAEQAGRNFLTALLRKESGAQIPPSEERSYGDIFLPRPGDKKEVIAQKREARRQAAIGIKMGLPAHIIKGIVQQGVDFSTLDPSNAPQQQHPGNGGSLILVLGPRAQAINSGWCNNGYA